MIIIFPLVIVISCFKDFLCALLVTFLLFSSTAFLKDQSSLCSRRLVLKHDCESLLALRIDTYTNMGLFAVSLTLSFQSLKKCLTCEQSMSKALSVSDI